MARQPGKLEAIWTAYYHALQPLGTMIMRIFALALELSEHFFDDKIDKHTTCLRVLNNCAPGRTPRTNDRWISTMHRVINPPSEHAGDSRRISLVFFHQPNYDAVVECLPSCQGHGNPAKYPPVTWGLAPHEIHQDHHLHHQLRRRRLSPTSGARFTER